MTPVDASLIDAGRRTLREASKPATMPLVFAIIGLGGCGLMVWRDQMRTDAQIVVLQRMADKIGSIEDQIGGLRNDFRVAGIKKAPRPRLEDE